MIGHITRIAPMCIGIALGIALDLLAVRCTSTAHAENITRLERAAERVASALEDANRIARSKR